jgi:urease gamma subunit
MALLLLKGPVKPRFFSSTIPEKYIIAQDAVITAAKGNRIVSINNKPAVAFVKDLGLFQDVEQTPNPAIPLIVESRNGVGLRAVIMQGTTPEGEVVCDNLMQVGDALSIGMVNADYVIESTASLIQDIKNNGSGESFLMFSCLLRSILNGGSHGEEIELMRKELGALSGPGLFISSAGEICPRYTETGKTLNQIYAYTLIACRF